MNALQRYELTRPILKGEKTPKQVSEETGVPLSTIYYYLKLLRESGGDIKSLEDKTHAIHSHPKRLTREDRDKVYGYPQSQDQKLAKLRWIINPLNL